MLRPNRIPDIDAPTLKTIRIQVLQFCKRQRLSTIDREDLIHEVTVHLLEKREGYNPRLGAWSTFVKCVLRNRLVSLSRSTQTNKNTHLFADRSEDSPIESDRWTEDAKPGRSLSKRPSSNCLAELRSDIEEVLGSLGADDSELCSSIMRASNMLQVCSELQISKSTIYRRLEEIRRHPSFAVLREYLSE